MDINKKNIFLFAKEGGDFIKYKYYENNNEDYDLSVEEMELLLFELQRAEPDNLLDTQVETIYRAFKLGVSMGMRKAYKIPITEPIIKKIR